MNGFKGILSVMAAVMLVWNIAVCVCAEAEVDNENRVMSGDTVEEYLRKIDTIVTEDPKEYAHWQDDITDLEGNYGLLVVLKKEFSVVNSNITIEYFPELKVKSVEKLNNIINPEGREYFNEKEYRDILHLVFDNQEDTMNARSVLLLRNDVKSVEYEVSGKHEFGKVENDITEENGGVKNSADIREALENIRKIITELSEKLVEIYK